MFKAGDTLIPCGAYTCKLNEDHSSGAKFAVSSKANVMLLEDPVDVGDGCGWTLAQVLEEPSFEAFVPTMNGTFRLAEPKDF